MTIIDALKSEAVEVRCDSRVLIMCEDFNDEHYFAVTDKRGKRLVETEVEDEAVRFLIGEK